jgi:hypothetical protein
MKLRHVIGLSGVLLGAALPAMAFQEQTVGGAPQAQPSEPSAAPQAGATKPAEMQLTPEEAAKPAEGTEVRIPGLGKLGVLPKMDFGLELLYGANEARPVTPDPQDQPDDLQIRGTVKHNF